MCFFVSLQQNQLLMKNLSFTILLLLAVVAGYAQPKEKLVPVSALASKEKFVLFSETRENPLQFNDSIPSSWLSGNKKFSAAVNQNEFFVFQIAVIALNEDIKTLRVAFYPLQGKNNTFNASRFTCFNTEGVDYKGNAFIKNINVPKGTLQPLWIGVQLSGVPDIYTSHVEVIINGKISKVVPVEFRVQNASSSDGGIGDPATLARLQWLNNTSGIDENVTKEYQPIARTGNQLKITGREIELGENGLPAQIKSYFTGANDIIDTKGQELLAAPFIFRIILNDEQEVKLKAGTINYTRQTPSRIEWQCTSQSPEVTLVCDAVSEFDGFSRFDLKVIGKKKIKIKDIRLDFEMPDKQAEYAMGMGLKGGYRPQSLDWKWQVDSLDQDAIWLGHMNGGVRLKFKDNNYKAPLLNVYYHYGKLNLPESWGNNGKGGFRFSTDESIVKATAYSGERQLQKKDTLHFDLELLVTPMKRYDKQKNFADRYSHPRATSMHSVAQCVEDIKKSGANIANIHHANNFYPYINYPLNATNVDSLIRVTNLSHENDIRLKLYYTTREITVNCPEFWAFWSMTGEVIYPGPGNTSKTYLHDKPDQWCMDNLRKNYLQAWVAELTMPPYEGMRDISVITTPDSRMNNFYIGGLDYMCRELKIDGVYIDDSALDRTTLRRARKIIDHYRPAGRIDLHSWNHFCPEGSWANSYNLYMDMLPYFDLAWIGEGRNYDEMPDHWLVEICGIPYGITGQMLQRSGNQWRGMVYGITTRALATRVPPDPIWKFWDDYRIADKDFIGYWDARNPVSVASDSVKATVYKGNKQSVIAVASWAKTNVPVLLNIDWEALGIMADKVVIHAPAVKNFQDEQTFQPNQPIEIPKGKGFLLIVEERE